MRHPHRWTQLQEGGWLCLCGAKLYKDMGRWQYRTATGKSIPVSRSTPPCPRKMSTLAWWWNHLRGLV